MSKGWVATFSGKVVAEAKSPYEMAVLLKKLGRHGCIVRQKTEADRLPSKDTS